MLRDFYFNTFVLKRIENIELYRVIASWMVMLFHFLCFSKNGTTYFSASTMNLATFGAQGVEFFYMISGFVMWYTLKQQQFHWRDGWNYLKKRFIRIIPTYWLTILGIVLLQFAWSEGSPFSLQTIVYNAFLLIGIDQETPWMNVVFGTLQLEIIFYLLLIFIAPLLVRSKHYFIPLLLFSAFLHLIFPTVGFFHFLPFFTLGITIAQLKFEWNPLLLFGMLILLFVLIWKYTFEDVLITAIAIVGLSVQFSTHRWIQSLGKGSYSLYLTHGIFGGTLLYYLYKFPFFSHHSWCAVLLAIISSVIGAQIMFRWFEQPISKWLSKKWLN